MTIADLLTILITPSCWVRNHPTDKTVDSFYRNLIEHKDEVKVIEMGDSMIAYEFRGRYFSSWIYGRYFAFLSRTYETKKENTHLASILNINKIEERLPSRVTAIEFYNMFCKDKAENAPEVDLGWLNISNKEV